MVVLYCSYGTVPAITYSDNRVAKLAKTWSTSTKADKTFRLPRWVVEWSNHMLVEVKCACRLTCWIDAVGQGDVCSTYKISRKGRGKLFAFKRITCALSEIHLKHVLASRRLLTYARPKAAMLQPSSLCGLEGVAVVFGSWVQ